jgi:Domain of unknown function (DUF1707)
VGGSVPELRASHADRDKVVEILRVAAGDGRLTADELDQRLEAALTARTYQELAALTADLPAAAGPRAEVPARPKDLVRIECKGSSVQRAGGWVVPKAMEVSAVGASVRLDFTEAVITEPVLRIDADVYGASLILVTRPGIEVDTDDVTLIGGSVSNRARPRVRPDQPVLLRVEVSGQNRGGTIKARPPRRPFWKWLRRRPRS